MIMNIGFYKLGKYDNMDKNEWQIGRKICNLCFIKLLVVKM